MIDTTGFPDELVKQLSKSKPKTSRQGDGGIILKIFIEAGVNTNINLDYLLVEYYRKTGRVLKRTTLSCRLSRLASNEFIERVRGSAGVYRLKGAHPRPAKEPPHEPPQP